MPVLSFLSSLFRRETDPDKIVQASHFPFYRVYQSGRIERILGTATVPPSLDPVTGVLSKDVTIDPANDVTARLYLPKSHQHPDSTLEKLPILIYYHGGGFVIESPFSPQYHSYLNSLVSQANVVAVSVHYRRAPEHLLPAAYDDSWTALKWVLSQAAGETQEPDREPWIADYGDMNRIYLAGDSAGGNIAPNIAMRVGSEGLGFGIEKVEGIILFHPYFWGTVPISGESTWRWRRNMMEGLWKSVNAPGVEVDDPLLNPTAGEKGRERLKGLGCRRVFVTVGARDLLAARGRKYYEDLKESGWEGEAEFHESEGEDHVFFLFRPKCKKALDLMEAVVRFLKKV